TTGGAPPGSPDRLGPGAPPPRGRRAPARPCGPPSPSLFRGPVGLWETGCSPELGGLAVERMTGVDAGFLYMETPTLHMHTLKIAVIDPANVPGGYTFDLLKEVLATRLKYLPPFRRRVVEVPFGLTHPVWIEDPDFDLDYHARRVAVPAPGEPKEFGELISDIASHQLGRRRPLWELWVVEGLEHGHIGVVAK